jgi:UDP-N-acetylmuramate: L-alanyl-gamma-D-glutamyl-meso-diaminopimelate ligase
LEQQFSSSRLAADLRALGKVAQSFDKTDAIIAALAQTCQSGDIVVILSNGGFDGIHDRLLTRLGQSA